MAGKKVIFKEPCNYQAQIIFTNGEKRRDMIAGLPSAQSLYNGKLDIPLASGNLLSLNWNEVALVEYFPMGFRDVAYEFPEDVANEMIAAGTARAA